MLTTSVHYGENNLNQTCANLHCGMARFKPKATHYHRYKNSWVCANCAQAINREHIAMFRDTKAPACINSEQYLIEKLIGMHA